MSVCPRCGGEYTTFYGPHLCCGVVWNGKIVGSFDTLCTDCTNEFIEWKKNQKKEESE